MGTYRIVLPPGISLESLGYEKRKVAQKDPHFYNSLHHCLSIWYHYGICSKVVYPQPVI